MKLILNNSSGESVFLNVNQDETFLDLKKRVQVEVGIALDLQDLTIKGKTIKDSQRVWDYFANREKIDEDVKEPVQDVQCSVPGCLNTKLSCADKAFFNFPLEEIRCHQWALYCQRLNPDPAKQRLALNLNSVICADHFSKDQFVKNTTTLLKRTAVPCVKPANAPDLPECHRPRILQRKAPTPTPLPITHNYDSLHESKADHAEPSSTMLCRLCANPSTDVMFIYDEIGNKLCLSEKINSCLPVTVRNTDPLPKQMCRSCFDKLSLCHELGEMCVKSEIKLRAMMEEKLFRSREVVDNTAAEDIKPSIQSIDYSEPNVISKTELINDNCLNKRSYCCPLCACGKMIAKSGIYRSNEFSPTNCTSNSIKYDESDSALETFSVDTENELNEAYNNAGKESWSSQDYGLKISELDMDAFYGSDGLVGMELDSVDEEPWDDDDDIKPVIKQEPSSFNCRLCGLHFASLISLLEHSHIHCDSECYPCSFCDRYYPSKADLEAHFEEHKSYRKRILDQSQFFQCETCGMGFKNSVKFHTHSCRSNSQTASIRCLECNKSFRSNARLQFHMRFHEGAKPGYCDICHKTFPDEVKLYKHTLYLHSQSKGHCCEECGKVFRSVSSLRYHQRSHQGEQIMKPFVCDQCGKCFIRKSMLQSHVISTHKNFSAPMKCYTCKICFEAFPQTDYAVAHMQVQHPSESSSEASYSFEVHEVTMLYICDYCERCYTNASRACEHRQHHSSDMLYQCKLCSTSFVNYSMLEDHKVIHPEQDFASQFVVPIVYICEYCERYFLNYVKLSEHTTVHFGDHPYQCRYCDMKFASYVQLATHKETHDLQSATPLVHFDSYRPYECHYCRKAFAIEDALVKHIRMHTGEKPFVCDQCGKGFSQSSGLYTHQKVHSNERPYSCPVCPRKFKIKGDRDVHVRKHSGDRPYKCDYCQKAFMTQHVYSQHRKIHTGERPYKCDVCGIAFRRSHVLTVHKRIHTGEKPNICDICGKRYRQKGDMLKHRRLQHGIVTVKLQRIEF